MPPRRGSRVRNAPINHSPSPVRPIRVINRPPPILVIPPHVPNAYVAPVVRRNNQEHKIRPPDIFMTAKEKINFTK